MSASLSIGIIAPSSKVPKVEFAFGVAQLKEDGFRVKVHPHCRKEHRFFAGNDEERAHALFDYARDPEFSVLWCARGGYGAARLLPILDRLTMEHGVPPRKLLAGYSDATILLEYARVRWKWPVLHAPMPGIRAFCALTDLERGSLVSWVRGESVPTLPWKESRLRFAGVKPQEEIRGTLIGGNLTVWTTLLGTPYRPQVDGKILFFEDIGEGLYRIDRMIQQLRLSDGFRGVRAVILGNFDGCQDIPPQVLAKAPSARGRLRALTSPRPADLAPLRKRLDAQRWIPKLFAEVCEEDGIPVAYGLPVGHGPGHASLPLGAEYVLGPEGSFRLVTWDWLS